MRILVTASTLPRWAGDSVPRFVLDQALALRRRHPDLDISIVAPHHAGAAIDEEVEGIGVHRFRYFWPSRLALLAYPAILPNLRRRRWLILQVPFLIAAEFVAVFRAARRRRPDLIYSHWFTPQALVGAAVGGLLGIPHVFTTHSSDAQVLSRLPLAGPALARRVTRAARAGTAVSRRTLAKLQAFFPRPGDWDAVAGRLRVLPMGVDLGQFPPASAGERDALRGGLGLAGARAVLFLGRLTAKKGVHLLLDAFATLAARHADLTLLIAGDGELRSAIERGIRDRGLAGRARMLGYLHGDAKRAFLVAADLLVLPSIVTEEGDAEGLPVVLLEGLAAGQVCVASDASGAEEVLVDGADGFVVPAGDAGALVAAMERVLALGPEARQAIVRRARARAQDFDWTVVAEAHYQHLLAARSAQRRSRN